MPRSSRRVTKLSELKRGDHISFDRKAYFHHALVWTVTSGQLEIISFTNPDEELIEGFLASLYDRKNPNHGKSAAYIAREVITSSKFVQEKIYVYDYQKDGSDPEIVIRRAGMVLRGEIPWDSYNLTNNNCEHFATWCKTGERKSKQVEVAGAALLVGGGLALLGGLGGLIYLAVKDKGKKESERERSYYY